ncbi:SMP-30/gluconolactonase/LRE family protein [Actinocatenispora rupis]|uniref:Gluconolactonase n=1 Tax=Actinocatenispora rupis TaxID=519421 RepID=A0A8J3J437_9ACTN|nr:SMP-30/gluconolactonase/LRE family protein [Actinocatenispora rupis]GID11266.1 gluconolactonase [Actinocatenispora rupis]
MVEQVDAPAAEHGEGPCWDATAGVLRWVDMLRGDLLAVAPGGGPVTRHHVGTVAAALRPRTGGGLVVATERGFALLDDPDGPVRQLPEVWTDPAVRMNDGGCDPHGRFYCGSMAYDATPGAAALYRLDPDGTVHTVLTGVTVSNGLAFTPDGTTAYYADTETGRVDAFSVLDGELLDRRPVVVVPAADGAPDGLTLDADGHLWVALWGGGAVRRYSPDGELEQHLPVPVRHVTACTFGGPGLDTLYVTTSTVDATPDEYGRAGALFAHHPTVGGLPPLPYAG